MMRSFYDHMCDYVYGKEPVDTRFYYLSLIKNEPYHDLEFSIHGFWPQNSKTDFPSFCKKVKFSINKLVPILPDLNKYWSSDRETNADFWKHEYAKHGSCVFTQMSEYEYFKKTLDLYQQAIKLNLPQKYYDPDSFHCFIPVTLDFHFYDDN